ncbi:hypothetical protein FHS39_002442 [Streptomyces olivoverticillatus]|uniref:diacylglycerol O-acyltransferase n=1 Tax=Streptomyces olivoverticillatus TaxID=66427 RepID=A0A7W7LPM3_9ACTN|nr:wax ester/triacylglycerol synthase domain-containing protein [Streptomyces olivoverticillatus]MBB4893411.1 hypothetical protein [Streptomyces olivoverticillatus]
MTPSKPPAALAASRHDAERSAGVEMPPLDAWLHRHQSSGAVCMTTGLLAWFEGTPPALPELRALAQRRWGPYARLRLTPGFHPAHLDWPRWTGGPDFDPAQHITSLPATGSAALEGLAAQLLAQPLGPSRPPWQLHLVPVEGGFALLLRAHHALLDGMSLITLLRALLAAPEATAGAVSSPRIPRQYPGPPRHALARALADVLPRARPLPFHGRVDTRRAVSWSRMPVAEVRAARDALPTGRASSNAVFLAATAGALRSAGVTGRLPLPGVCAMVPVDVRTEGETVVLGNHYATVRVPLPARGRPVQRLAAVDAFTRRAALKERARAQALMVSSAPRRYGLLSDALGRYADSPLYSSLLCSSAATYTGPLALGSARLAAVAGLAPLSPGHPLALTMILHDASVVVTAVTDQAHRELAARIPELIREEIRAMGT